jgi:CheY-like chemotaxis protein/signal transduction histidine kinase/HAMP domain-containing protein
VDVKGEILELKNTINTMVDQLNSFASEVTRVAREVGTEGKLGGQARVEGVAGTWKDLTDSVNLMAGNLTGQVRNIAEVTTAVASGNLSKKITVDVKGEILELKNTINTMVDQLNSFASEVTRVAREVGTEGKLGGQAQVKGVGGTWKDLTDNVNLMAANLTGQVRNIADVTTAVASGNLSKKITVDVKGEILELKNTINTMVDQLNSFASEVTRVAREVGTEGKLGGQARVEGVAGTWKDLTDNVNLMAGNLTGQVRNIAEVTTAVANGDLSKKITVDVKGEILELKNTINTMVDQLNSFASEVTRVAREVGTEGKLGGQAQVKGVAGTWKELTDNVNLMASNLTSQVRGIAQVVTAVATGDLKRKLAVEASGEIAALADTINGMIDTLATFADQVTDVAREVGIDGKLGGQARVPGAAGLWRDLTDNVNQLAANLTTQVRAIAEVATAVTKGDLTRSITVEALGEVASLKDNINEMIRNLADTTRKNTEQDWLKTNLAKFTRMLQGERDLVTVTNLILSEIAPLVSASHGVFYLHKFEGEEQFLDLVASYAYKHRKHLANRFQIREGLIGQCAYEKRPILLTHVPADYIQINSGLGEAPPLNIIVLPVLFEGEIKAVLELASFEQFSDIHQSFLDQLMESIGIVLNTIAANMRTERLLTQSQLLTSELQSQQEELKKTNDRLEQQAASLQKSEELLKTQQDELRNTNEELEEKAQLLSMQKKQVEIKNQEIERAKVALEDKAEQLALTSKYKSEFLANMSHELRTPLNSLLVLSKILSDNVHKNLTEKEVQFAETIHTAGTELLTLINDILDLSKIESGTVTLDMGELNFVDLKDYFQRSFGQIANDKHLRFDIDVDGTLPEIMQTDSKRLQQVIKNLLSNSFKFTERGEVKLKISRATAGWSSRNSVLNSAPMVVSFSVRDTGIGIAPDKQKVIFEAFQQADGTTSRKYGGTGLGLSISRELARLLGGEITVTSELDAGSTFTLFVPVTYEATNAPGPVIGVLSQPREDSRKALPPPVAAPVIEDDRAGVRPGDRTLVIVEDDVKFADVLLQVARDKGFKGLVASTGTDGLVLTRDFKPDAVVLDVRLPDMDGWRFLDLMKRNPDTRHVPVSIVSAADGMELAPQLGAFSVLAKPVERDALFSLFDRTAHFLARPVKKLLVVEDDEVQSLNITTIVGEGDVETVLATSGAEAIKVIGEQQFDCVILDLGLPDMDGIDVLEQIRKKEGNRLPVIVYTARDLSRRDEIKLRKLAETVIVKNPESLKRLYDESALFLHRLVAGLPPEKQILLNGVRQREPVLAGRKVLIVDDDVRNIFSLASLLEQHQMEVLHAENGRDAIAILGKTPSIDLVLMDVMMPEMDGYETMRSIRARERFRTLPVIAVTAKAMKEDREKCIQAGASDYAAKPVDIDQIISVLRVWLRKTPPTHAAT